jgi:hypothetical protein
MFQHVRHWQTNPNDCSCDCCANSPDQSRSSTKNEKHSYNQDWTDLSPECEVIYGRDSSAHNQSDSGTHRNITLRFHTHSLCITKSPGVNRYRCNQEFAVKTPSAEVNERYGDLSSTVLLDMIGVNPSVNNVDHKRVHFWIMAVPTNRKMRDREFGEDATTSTRHYSADVRGVPAGSQTATSS